MYNLSYVVNENNTVRVVAFDDHIVDHSARKCVNDVPTPFDNPYNGNTLMGHYVSESSSEESIRCSLSRTKRSISSIASNGHFCFFCTFTFDPSRIDRFNYDSCSSCMQDFIRSLKKTYPDLQYLLVPELHKNGAFHFHGLFSRHISRDLLPVWDYKRHCSVYFFRSFPGRTQVELIRDIQRISSYIQKYITKDLLSVSKGRRRYWYSHSTIHLPEKTEVLIYQNSASYIAEYVKEILGGSCYVCTSCPYKAYIFTFDSKHLAHFLSVLHLFSPE